MVSLVACYCSLCKMSLTPRTDAFLGVHFANHVAGLVVQFSAHYETHVFPCRANAFKSPVVGTDYKSPVVCTEGTTILFL